MVTLDGWLMSLQVPFMLKGIPNITSSCIVYMHFLAPISCMHVPHTCVHINLEGVGYDRGCTIALHYEVVIPVVIQETGPGKHALSKAAQTRAVRGLMAAWRW